MKVLISDDNELTRRRVEAVVRKWGYSPLSASDGSQAWDVLNSPDSPRIAILDWHMPKVDGLELCRRVRERDGENYTYLILLTGSTDQGSVVEGLKAGADDFMGQPFDAAELEQRLRTGRRIIELQDRLLEIQGKLQLQATRDALTGIWNRGEILRFLDEEFGRSNRDDRPLGLMLVDIDHFKLINDRFGHLAGDETLRRVAASIQANVRAYDRVGRYGGEEFLVVLPDADQATTTWIGERIRRKLQESALQIESERVVATASIGAVSICGGTDGTLHEALQRADEALYRAKQMGRNRVCEAGDVTGPAQRKRVPAPPKTAGRPA